ncbi:2-alkenal reductase (NADP(+)-dependent) [Linum grandiflorum]
MTEVENKQVVLKSYITDGRAPTEDDMAFTVSKLSDLKAPKGSGAFLVKNLYLSCDPYMRGRMRPPSSASYIPSFLPGHPIEGFGVSEVVDSDNPDYKAGDLIAGMTGWEEYSLIREPQQLRKINQNDDVPLSYNLGLLGMPGFTAYCGFYELCSPKAGDFVFVSAASGAVGQIVGQLAKLQGCYVVGSAGSTTKVDILKEKMGFDAAFNYKQELDLDQALKRHFPEGIDIYFDNVGGQMLDAALLNMKVNGRIAVCGMVSQNSVNDPGAGIRNIFSVVMKRITMQGFLQSDFLHLYPSFLEHVTAHYLKGNIVYVEDMDDGLDRAPAALAGLFTGHNVGKKVVRVASQE